MEKNAQQPKGKGENSLASKEKNSKPVSTSKPTTNDKSVPKSTVVGKENDPSTSTSVSTNSKEEINTEEQFMLDYMRTMYRTRGESLLKKFRSEESIRKALAVIDENDYSKNWS